MAMVKGSLVIDIVKLIRTNPDKNWDKYLKEEDKKIIWGERILPSSWYPLDFYERAGYAIFKEIGKGDLNNARIWGRFIIEDITKNIYRGLMEDMDPFSGIKKFAIMRKQLFKFDTPEFEAIKIEIIGKNKLKVSLRSEYSTHYFEAYTYQAIGSLERIAEMNGGKNIKIEIIEHNWSGLTPYSILEISWE